jgi:threonine dehydrogenase-like Zn-dependent dehydrogenase
MSVSLITSGLAEVLSQQCSVCRLGYTARCPEGLLFGSPALEGGQAQYVRVPKGGGTLFNLNDPTTWSSSLPKEIKEKALASLPDSSLLTLADILPTGIFAVQQAINHPKLAPVVTGKPWPLCFGQVDLGVGNKIGLTSDERILTVAIIGLGPVGVCAAVSMLDVVAARQLPFRMVAIDPVEARREKMKAVYDVIDLGGKGTGEFAICSIDEARVKVREWTAGVGCTTVLEVRVLCSHIDTTIILRTLCLK